MTLREWPAETSSPPFIWWSPCTWTVDAALAWVRLGTASPANSTPSFQYRCHMVLANCRPRHLHYCASHEYHCSWWQIQNADAIAQILHTTTMKNREKNKYYQSTGNHEIGSRHPVIPRRKPTFASLKGGRNMQRHRQNHLRLHQPQTHFMMFGKVHNACVVCINRFTIGCLHSVCTRAVDGCSARHRSHQTLLALQRNGHLHTTHRSRAKIQSAHNIFAELKILFEQTKSSDASAFIRYEIEIGSTTRCSVLQMMQGNFQFGFGRFAIFQKRIGGWKFIAGLVAQRWYLIGPNGGGQRKYTNWQTQYLHLWANLLCRNGDFVRIANALAAIGRRTGQRKRFSEQIWNWYVMHNHYWRTHWARTDTTYMTLCRPATVPSHRREFSAR